MSAPTTTKPRRKMGLLRGTSRRTGDIVSAELPSVAPQTRLLDPIAIPPGDPLESILLSSGGPVQIQGIDAESETIDLLRDAGVELIVPLIGQGELIGALYLGSRLSDQPYSSDDRRLLGSLASQVAPAMKVAQLVREQQAQAKERERIQQELEVAALIQHTLLPKELPRIEGWGVDAFYRPARAVGGDFYDFIHLSDGRLGVVIGDVTDKGVPAALVMATCRSMLRAATQRFDRPSEVLASVNDDLVAEIPPAMFVTCLYAIVDTDAGEVTFANAGHNLPYVRTGSGVSELRATGMPLGLMPGMDYDDHTHHLERGDVMVLTSDGITEAHNDDGEMYGFGRLIGRVAKRTKTDDLIASLVADLERWVGAGAEQEDDITLVVVRRSASGTDSVDMPKAEVGESRIVSFRLPSVEGNERIAIDTLDDALEPLRLSQSKLERLKTAVGETVMNAIEHGNRNDPVLEVGVEVVSTPSHVVVRISDQGGDREIPMAEEPDLEAKLEGLQTPRGWGLFLVSELVDEVRRTTANGSHVVELLMRREGESDVG